MSMEINLTVNGVPVKRQIEPRTHLVDFLREQLGLTGSHLGCEHGACGACTVKVDGHIARGCLVLAAQADGAQVETIETATPSPALKALQAAFVRRNALQCGYCSSGMLMTCCELVETRPQASREEIREWISGNYCRCTGYHAIVDAVSDVLTEMKEGVKQGVNQGAQA